MLCWKKVNGKCMLKNKNHETNIEKMLLGVIYNWIIDMTAVGDGYESKS